MDCFVASLLAMTVLHGKPHLKNLFCGRLSTRRAFASSSELALPSVSGSSPRSLRQAPRAWARAKSREPRDPGLPFRLSPVENLTTRLASDNKKPSGAAGSGGSTMRTVDVAVRSEERRVGKEGGS